MPPHNKPGRSRTAIMAKIRKTIAADEPDCHLCNKPIDYSIKDGYHPKSFTADHVIPRARGGLDIIENFVLPDGRWSAAHRDCNVKRQDKPLIPVRGCTFVTERTWTPNSPTLEQAAARR